MEELINLDSESESSPDKYCKTQKIILDKYFSVTLKISDYQRLNPEVYLNDNLIDFFLAFFIHKKKSFHAFNSFFFKTFSEFGFSSVQKWFKSIDLFSKKYWMIPVARMEHWMLIIVTNPKNAFIDKKPSPTILFFDSLDFQNFNPKCEIQTFMEKLWKACSGKDEVVDVPIYMLKLPIQKNFWDCGVFLLKYAEIFVDNPGRFAKPDQFFDDLFRVEDMAEYRWQLKNTILELSENAELSEVAEKVVLRIKAAPEILKTSERKTRYNLRKKTRC